MSYLADNASIEESLGEMVKDYYKDKSVDSVARDSTAISARATWNLATCRSKRTIAYLLCLGLQEKLTRESYLLERL